MPLIRRKMVEKGPYPTKNGLKGALIRRKMAKRGLKAPFIYRFRRNCQFSPNVGATGRVARYNPSPSPIHRWFNLIQCRMKTNAAVRRPDGVQTAAFHETVCHGRIEADSLIIRCTCRTEIVNCPLSIVNCLVRLDEIVV